MTLIQTLLMVLHLSEFFDVPAGKYSHTYIYNIYVALLYVNRQLVTKRLK